jgi:capsular polysaccharide transport system ATP-binding protein
MITIENVSKAYRTKGHRKIIVDDLSCVLAQGRNLGILGENGAGKSTLMRMISGIELPDSGRIRRACRVSFPLGFSGSFAGSLTGRENAMFLARVYGESVRYVVDFAEDFAEIGSYFDMPVSTYSSGMRARLAFGVSMAIDFDVYLVDEVTAVGDQRFQNRCREMLTERFKHSDVIMISHGVATLKEYCQYGAVLHRGRLHFYDSIDLASAAHVANQHYAPAG